MAEDMKKPEPTGTQAPKKKKRKVRLKKEARAGVAFAVSFLVVMTAYLIYHQLTKFDYADSLGEIVVTVDQTNISLKEMTYYLIQVERTGNEYAEQYNPDNLSAYWGIYMNSGEETGYVTNLAKDAAMNYCVRDNIYAMEAEEAGLSLSQEELTELKADAESTYLAMSLREREVSELTAQDLEIILEKEQLCYKYMAILAENYDGGALEAVTEIYDVGGTYYNELLKKYTVTTNDKLWKNIKPGHITIN